MEETTAQHTVTRTLLPLGSLVANTGQVPGLPRNPRGWTRADVGRLAESLTETPELFDARGLIVYPYEGKNVVVAGNMRLEAARRLNLENVPCLLLHPDTSVDALCAIAIKDNGAWGAWDTEALGAEWADMPLADWGIADWDSSGSEGDENYTRKIVPPEYVPKETEPVPVADLVDEGKTLELIAEIDATAETCPGGIPDDVKRFLHLAAERHRTFNFARIAEYYSQCKVPEIRRLFERSALVIIDWDAAISGGFVRLSEQLLGEYAAEYPAVEEEEGGNDA